MRILLAIPLLLGGCTVHADWPGKPDVQHFRVPATRPTTRPVATDDALILSQDLTGATKLWLDEARKAGLRNPYAVTVHGFSDGRRWLCKPDVGPVMDTDTLIAAVRAFVPKDRDLLVLICNQGGFVPSAPNVWYAPRVVWAIPGNDVRWIFPGIVLNNAGGIDDFVRTP